VVVGRLEQRTITGRRTTLFVQHGVAEARNLGTRWKGGF
jgi:hypothetical protein